MNDSNSNNNVFGTTNNINNIPTTPEQPINNIINNVNSNPEINNNNIQPQSNTAVNRTLDFNYGFSANNVSTSIPNEGPQPSQNLNNVISSQPNTPSQINNRDNQQNFNNNSGTNEELLRAFIGNNYEKITTKLFNFAGFFFTTFYMFYRKMFGYAILVFLFNFVILNIINNYFIVSLAFNVIVGLLVNKIYLFYAKKKIAKIVSENAGKDINELKNICASKGGTSVGKIFLGFITELGIVFVVLFLMLILGISSTFGQLFHLSEHLLDIYNWNITQKDGSNTNDSSSSTSKTLVENVSVSSYYCFNSTCNVTIYDSNNSSTDYALNINNSDLFKTLGDYTDYIKLNIYYTQKENEKTIVDYKIYLKSNNEDISSVKTENELREKIGLYSIGTHTASFTLTKIGSIGIGSKGDTSYTYTTYTFVDSKNIEYKMKYINTYSTLNLVENTKYNVTFEVLEDTFGYEFIIKSIN